METSNVVETKFHPNKKKRDVEILSEYQLEIKALKRKLDDYFNTVQPIEYLDEVREITLSLEELRYKNNYLTHKFSNTKLSESDLILWSNELKAFVSDYGVLKNALSSLVQNKKSKEEYLAS